MMKAKMRSRIIVVAFIGMAVSVLFAFKGSFAALRLGQPTARHSSETIEECMDRFRDLLYDEILVPTERRRGAGGGYIDHEYQIAQIITAFRNLLSPPTTSGRGKPSKSDIAYLKAMMSEEALEEAKDVFRVVLGYCGDPSVEQYLITIAKGEGRPHIRQRAIGALRDGEFRLAIPDLIELLNDPDSVEVPKHIKTSGKDFLVRGAASFALRKFGVDVGETGESQYQADVKSAVRVLEKELETASIERISRTLQAIYRVGGEPAQKALENFAERNASNESKKALVSEAKKLLSEINTNQPTESDKEKKRGEKGKQLD